MSMIQSKIKTSNTERPSQFEPDSICCYLDAEVFRWTWQDVLSGEQLLAAHALQLLMRLDRELRAARADWNQDRFRRVMRARSKAVSRVRRRWKKLDPAPAIGLGKLRRRYHANLAGYLYGPESAMTDLGNEDKTCKREVQDARPHTPYVTSGRFSP